MFYYNYFESLNLNILCNLIILDFILQHCNYIMQCVQKSQ